MLPNMTSLCLGKLRIAGALAFIGTTIFVACGVPDYSVPTPQEAGVAPSASGGKTGVGGAGAGGGTANTTGGAPQNPFNCNSNSDCTTFAATKVCESTVTHHCVECVDNSSCGPGLYCDTKLMTCQVGCSKDADCGVTSGDASPGTPLTCDATTHQCAGCEVDADCKTGTQCDPTTGACIPGCGADKNCPTNWSCCGGECANPQLDVDNCSTCGKRCPAAHATAQCLNGQCGIVKCNDGYADCNNDLSDDCEVNTLTDNKHCGDCKTVCPTGQVCISGACAPASCNQPGFKNCSADPMDPATPTPTATPPIAGNAGTYVALRMGQRHATRGNA